MAHFDLRIWLLGFGSTSLYSTGFLLSVVFQIGRRLFSTFGPANMGERGTPLSVGEPTLYEIGTSLKRQLMLTDREKVGVVIEASTVSDRFVGFI